MGRNGRKIAALSAALLLALVGAAFAVPVFQLNVQQIGEGGPAIITVPGGVTLANLTWVLNTTNPDYVQGASVSFNQTLVAGTTIYVKVYDATGTIIALGSTTLTTNLTAGTPVTITFANQVEIKDMDQVGVVLLGPAP